MNIDKQERMRRAEELFMQGFNCSQSVAAAFADVYGYTEEQPKRWALVAEMIDALSSPLWR